jgi:hypothetical protein
VRVKLSRKHPQLPHDDWAEADDTPRDTAFPMMNILVALKLGAALVWASNNSPTIAVAKQIAPTGNRRSHANALFDLALVRDDAGVALLATTECYRAGCRERLFSPRDGLLLPPFSEPAAAPVSISIVVRELNNPPEKNSIGEEDRLLRTFARFAAQIDLSPLLEPVTVKTNQAEREARGRQP